MSSPDNSNPFKGLASETPAPGHNGAADESGRVQAPPGSSAATTGLDVTTLGSALDEVTSGADKGKKRPATEPAVRYSPEQFKKQLLELREKHAKAKQAAEVAAKDSQPATATAAPEEPTAMSTPVSPKDGTEMEVEEEKEVPFPFTLIPKKPPHFKCALSVDKQTAVGNPRGSIPLGYSLQITMNPSRLGWPSLYLTFRVNTENLDQPFDGARKFESTTITWYPAEKAGNSYQIEEFQEESHSEWAKKDPLARVITQSFIKDIDLVNCNLRVLTFKAQGGEVVQSGTCSLQHLDWATSNPIKTAFSTSVKLIQVFFLAPGEQEYARTLHPFQRCVEERRGFFHQYREKGNGKWQLDNFQTAPTVQEVGNGMYMKPEGGFIQLPLKQDFRDVDDFMVHCSLTPIREGQYHLGRDSLLRKAALECHVVRPRLSLWKESQVPSSRLSQERKQFKDWALVYVRLPSKNKSDLKPEPGCSITLEWHNPAALTKKHVKGEKRYAGIVVTREPSEFQATRTDFCVCLRMPSGAEPRTFNKDQLPKAYLDVAHNLNPIWREQEATKAMWNSNREEHVAFLKHLALDEATATSVQNLTDLSEGIVDEDDMDDDEDLKTAFEDYARLIKEEFTNEAQSKVIDGLKNVVNNYLGVTGPSGTGKTNLIKRIVWLLVSVGHKIAVCAPSNTAADHVGKAICACQPDLLDDKKILRLEVNAIEKIRMAKGDTGDPNETWSTRPKPDSMSNSEEGTDPRVDEAFSLLMSEHSADLDKYEEFNNFRENFEQMESHVKEAMGSRMRQVHAPYPVTLGYHIKSRYDADLEAAQAEYDKEWQETPVTERDDLKTVAERNPSHSYIQWYNYFLAKEGKLDTNARKHFLSARQEIEERVIHDIDVLVVTLNNAGSDFADLGFNPSVIIIDEAGQASFSALFVPLVTFKHYKAVLMFGDPQQLAPTILAKGFSENAHNSQVSPLKLMYRKDRNLYYLTDQYRMAAAIHSFPARHFYSGKLTCNPAALVDNDIRRAVRGVSSRYYNIKGESEAKDGSELFMIDVVRTSARVEPNGTSLLNHGNADAVNLVVNRLLKAGVPSSSIVILTFYKGQMKLIASTINKTRDGQTKYEDISTVDAFQGRESPVIILDFVVAREYDNYDPSRAFELPATDTAEDAAADDEMVDPDISTGQRYPIVTPFARDYHRTCVGLTRAMDGLILVGQQTLLLHTTNTTKDTLWNTQSAMIRDLNKRELIYSDLTTLDSHPDAVKEREAMSAAEKMMQEQRTSEANRFAFIDEMVKRGRHIKQYAETGTTELYGTQVEEEPLPNAPRPSPAEYEASRNRGRGRGRGPNRGGGRGRGQQGRGGGPGRTRGPGQ